MHSNLKETIIELTNKSKSYHLLNEFKNLKVDILLATSGFDKFDASMGERTHAIINGLDDRPICDNCGNNVKYILQGNYNKNCSAKCRTIQIHKNMSDVKKKRLNDKKSFTMNNMSDEVKNDRSERLSKSILLAFSKRTKEDRERINSATGRRIKYIRANLTDEELNNSVRKRQATWANKSQEERLLPYKNNSPDLISLYKDNPKGKLKGHIYLAHFESDTESFYKIGITSNEVEKRFLTINDYCVTIIDSKTLINYDCAVLEKKVHDKFEEQSYTPKHKFSGWTECFTFEDENLKNWEVVKF